MFYSMLAVTETCFPRIFFNFFLLVKTWHFAGGEPVLAFPLICTPYATFEGKVCIAEEYLPEGL